jgi:diguanylate cyclase (GGDEF)-like protein/PAS domain S-box-containing protein
MRGKKGDPKKPAEEPARPVADRVDPPAVRAPHAETPATPARSGRPVPAGPSGDPARLLDAMVEATTALVFFKDAAGRYLRINRALAARYGLPDPAQAVGKTDFDFHPTADAERFRVEEQEILRSGHSVIDREEPGAGPGGRRIWTSTTRMPLRDTDGRIIGIFGIAHDITALKQAEAGMAEQAGLVEGLFASSPDPVWLTDDQGRLQRVNGACAGRFGLDDPAKAAGRTEGDFRPPEEADAARRDDEEVRRTGQPVGPREERWTTAKGAVAWFSMVRRPVRDPAGRLVGILAVAQDVTARRLAEQGLAELSVRWEALVDGLSEGVWFKDAGFRYVRVNRAQAARLGLRDPAEAVGKGDADIMPPDAAAVARRIDEEVLRAGAPTDGQEEAKSAADGSMQWSQTRRAPVRDREGRIVGLLGIVRDITDRKRMEDRLVQHAFYDAVTGLSNRALFLDRLDNHMRRALRRQDILSAVVVANVDRFRDVNEGLGPRAGDELLFAVARRIERCLRPGDSISRLGADSFGILLEDVVEIGAVSRVAKRIQQEVAAPCIVGGAEVSVTVSVGIALSSNRYERPEDMLRDADTALHRGQARGKAALEVFDPAMHERSVQLLQTETDLRLALERREFLLHYQPVVSMIDRRLSGFEALLRWRHPRRGLLAAAAFVPQADEAGLIVPVGLWALREACRQTRDWQRRFPLPNPIRVSVNISRRQITQRDFVDQVRQILDETGLDPASLTLEISEHAILEGFRATAALLEKIRALSIQLHVDDVGRDGIAAGQLPSLPIHGVMVDWSLLRPPRQTGEAPEAVRTIAALAQSLGLGVTAEGVEAADQFEALRRMKCANAQGFFFSQPLDVAAAEALLAKGARW